MTKIKFMTDSASDISVEHEREFDIKMMNFPVTFGDKTYISRVDMDNKTFYEKLESSPTIPATAQITVFQYSEAFEEIFSQGYTDVINVIINAEGSGTYNSACLATEMFRESHPGADFRIHNIDSRTYTCGYGYAVVEGAHMAANGKSLDEILTFIRDWIENNIIYFVPYTLKYAGKSGRIPSAAAFVGELVGLKPVMRIYDHAIVTDDKIRGEKKIIPTVVKKILADMQLGAPYTIIYGSCVEDGEAMAQAMTEAVGYPPVMFTEIGAVVATNAGPRVVGVSTHLK